MRENRDECCPTFHDLTSEAGHKLIVTITCTSAGVPSKMRRRRNKEGPGMSAGLRGGVTGETKSRPPASQEFPRAVQGTPKSD
jgi:hypothetical protein